MIVLYLRENHRFIQAIPGFPPVAEEQGKLYLNGRAIVNNLEKVGYFYCEDKKIERKVVWNEDFGVMREVPQTVDDLGLVAYGVSEQERIIDHATGKAINETVHPFAGTDESIGTIREMVVQIINAIGLAPTDDFARLNEIAIAAIKDGAAKKAALK